MKNIDCQPQISKARGESVSGHSESRTSMRRPERERPSEQAQTGGLHASADQHPLSLETEYSTTNLSLLNFQEEQFDWDILDLDVSGLYNSEDPPLRTDLLEPMLLPYSEQSQSLARFGCQVGPKLHGKGLSVPKMPAYSMRSFTQNPALKSGTQGATAMLMYRILTSYPMMMRGPESLPPFIHPSFLSHDETSENTSFESLTTCMSLMQMVSTHAPGSRRLLWKNVRLECERLHEEVSTPSSFTITK